MASGTDRFTHPHGCRPTTGPSRVPDTHDGSPPRWRGAVEGRAGAQSARAVTGGSADQGKTIHLSVSAQVYSGLITVVGLE